MQGYKHINFSEREMIGRMYNKGFKVPAIARALGRCRQTIHDELKRGLREQLDGSTWKTHWIYDPDEAQKDYDEKASKKGAALKIGRNHKLATDIEHYILEVGCSPYDALCRLGNPFCVSTLYSYIDKGIFLRLSNKDLPEKSKRKPRAYRKIKKAKRAPAGTSIDFRGNEINDRLHPFHWEMDCVLGKKDQCKKALLVFTERLTRAELIFLLKDKRTETVVNLLNRLSKRPFFCEVFKSITVDNGSEFSASFKLEHDRHGKRRTSVYYCHPYSSFERGSNENANRLVRRKFPRGLSFKKVRQKDAYDAMCWMNEIHRRLLHGMTAEQRFNTISPVPLETFYKI